MEELVKLVSQKANITEDQARTAVTVVLNFVKQKLPAPIASQVDGVLNSSGSTGGLGSLFGQKK